MKLKIRKIILQEMYKNNYGCLEYVAKKINGKITNYDKIFTKNYDNDLAITVGRECWNNCW